MYHYYTACQSFSQLDSLPLPYYCGHFTREAEVRTAAGRLVSFLRTVPGSEEASAATVAARDAHADGMREQLAARAAAAAERQREQCSDLPDLPPLNRSAAAPRAWTLRTDREGAGRMRVLLERAPPLPGGYARAAQRCGAEGRSSPRRRLSSATTAAALGDDAERARAKQEGSGVAAHMITPMNATRGTLRLANRLGWRLEWSARRTAHAPGGAPQSSNSSSSSSSSTGRRGGEFILCTGTFRANPQLTIRLAPPAIFDSTTVQGRTR